MDNDQKAFNIELYLQTKHQLCNHKHPHLELRGPYIKETQVKFESNHRNSSIFCKTRSQLISDVQI